MNIERLKELREAIVKTEYFDMCRYFVDTSLYEKFVSANECGTPSCIAGHAIVMYPEEATVLMNASPDDEEIFYGQSFHVAKSLLGLNQAQAVWLFMGNFKTGDDVTLDGITSEESVQALDMLIAGEY